MARPVPSHPTATAHSQGAAPAACEKSALEQRNMCIGEWKIGMGSGLEEQWLAPSSDPCSGVWGYPEQMSERAPEQPAEKAGFKGKFSFLFQ